MAAEAVTLEAEGRGVVRLIVLGKVHCAKGQPQVAAGGKGVLLTTRLALAEFPVSIVLVPSKILSVLVVLA